jgi:glucose-6-phosphate-specific signal transduction histidine kinase
VEIGSIVAGVAGAINLAAIGAAYKMVRDQYEARLARERETATEMVTKERTTNAEVTRLWQERVNREVAATRDAEERCVAQAAAYERKLADAAERVDQLIGLGHAAVQTTRRVAGK